jgi:hypothetical protein
LCHVSRSTDFTALRLKSSERPTRSATPSAASSGLLELHEVNPPRQPDFIPPLPRYYKDKVTVDEHAPDESLKASHSKFACFKRFATRKMKKYVPNRDNTCDTMEEAGANGQPYPASSKSVPTKYRGPKPFSWLKT